MGIYYFFLVMNFVLFILNFLICLYSKANIRWNQAAMVATVIGFAEALRIIVLFII